MTEYVGIDHEEKRQAVRASTGEEQGEGESAPATRRGCALAHRPELPERGVRALDRRRRRRCCCEALSSEERRERGAKRGIYLSGRGIQPTAREKLRSDAGSRMKSPCTPLFLPGRTACRRLAVAGTPSPLANVLHPTPHTVPEPTYVQVAPVYTRCLHEPCPSSAARALKHH